MEPVLTYSLLANHRQAGQDLERAVGLAPCNAEVYFKRGLDFFRAESYQKGLDDLSQAVRLDPIHAEAYRDRARAYVFMGMEEETQRDAKRAVEHRRASFIITNNPAVEEWLRIVDDPILGNSAMDRLANASYWIIIEGLVTPKGCGLTEGR